MRNALYKRMKAIGEQYQFDPQNQDYRTAIENAVSDMFEKEKRAGSMSTFKKAWSADNTAREGAAGRAYLRVFYSPVGSNRQLMIDCTLTRQDVSVFASFIQ
jgi:phage tail sheath protein FI